MTLQRPSFQSDYCLAANSPVLWGRAGSKSAVARSSRAPCEPTELAAMNYVAKHISIPIPKIINAYEHHDALYIEIEYIPAMDLEKAWLGGHLSQVQKEHMFRELPGYVS